MYIIYYIIYTRRIIQISKLGRDIFLILCPKRTLNRTCLFIKYYILILAYNFIYVQIQVRRNHDG